MYYRARYYDPSLGQFISPDTIVPDPSNVLDYNRYLYVRGNAINLNDPSGHTCHSPGVTGSISSGDCGEIGGGGLRGGGGRIGRTAGLAVRGLAVGGIANASANAFAQGVENYDEEDSLSDTVFSIDENEVAVAALFGGLTGLAAPLPGAWPMLIGGAAGGAQQVTTEVMIDGSELPDAVNTNTVIATGLGLAGGLAQGAFPDELAYPLSEGGELGVATGLDALAYGGRHFANNTNRTLFGQQGAYLFSGRFVSGYFISSLPVDGNSYSGYAESVRGPR